MVGKIKAFESVGPWCFRRFVGACHPGDDLIGCHGDFAHGSDHSAGDGIAIAGPQSFHLIFSGQSRIFPFDRFAKRPSQRASQGQDQAGGKNFAFASHGQDFPNRTSENESSSFSFGRENRSGSIGQPERALCRSHGAGRDDPANFACFSLTRLTSPRRDREIRRHQWWSPSLRLFARYGSATTRSATR